MTLRTLITSIMTLMAMPTLVFGASEVLTPKMEIGSTEIVSGSDIIMEVDSVAVSTNWSTVSFSNDAFEDPVVVAVHENTTSTSASVRIRNISASGFQVRLQNSNPADDLAADSTVRYIAVEKGTWFLDGYKVEADSIDTSLVGSRGNWEGTPINYEYDYNEDPLVLHQVQTYNDADWITSWVSDSDRRSNSPDAEDGFQIGLNGSSATSEHGEETIGWIVMESDIQGTVGDVRFETITRFNVVKGFDNNDCEVTDYNYVDSSTAITIVSQQSLDNNDGGWVVLCSHGSTSFGIYQDEDTVGDSERRTGLLDSDDYAALVFSDEISVVNDSTYVWDTVDFQQSYESPVVIITSLEGENIHPLSARVQNVTSESFQVALQNSNNSLGYQGTIHYMVVEEGKWQMGNTKIEAGLDTISTVGSSPEIGGSWEGEVKNYQHEYNVEPLVMHQVQTYNDANWITSWVSSATKRKEIPGVNKFRIGLNGARATTTHEEETVGWVVMDRVVQDSYEDVGFRTYLGEAGMVPSDGDYCKTFDHEVGEGTAVGIVSQMTMNGKNGSWAIMCEISDSTIGMRAEQDTEVSRDLSHVRESMGYAIFERGFVAAGGESPTMCYELKGDNIDNDGDGRVDEFNTLANNCVHPVFGYYDSTNTDRYRQAVSRVRGAKKGKIFVTYTDGSVYRYDVYGTKSNRKTKPRQYKQTGYQVVMDPFAKRIALMNVFNGTIHEKHVLFRNHNKRKYFDNAFRIADLQGDGKPEAVVIGKRKRERVRVTVVPIKIRREQFRTKATSVIYDERIQPSKTKISGNTIKLKQNANTVLYNAIAESNSILTIQ